ncbi:MAG: alkaline phosphatase family protein [Candidatus Neomarinimicrobiota bacterium]|nr:MAG: alkaline phosphatase family protein [Candidatus Neomarinimicrobiota bacterium]
MHRFRFPPRRLWMLLSLVWLGTACQPPQSPAPAAPRPTPVILISLDGFRYDYAGKTDTPALDRIAREGVRAEGLIPAFPSKTFPNHYTIVTGLYPEHHGLVSNRMYDPKFDAWYRIGQGSQAVTEGRWYGGEPIWSTVEKAGKIAATMFWPGSEAEIAGERPTYWFPYDHTYPNDRRVQQILNWMARPKKERPLFMSLYFPDTDDAGHHFGPDSSALLPVIREVDHWIGVLLDSLEARQQLDSVNIMVVSDHGMAELSPERVVYLDDYVETDRLTIIDWWPVLNILIDTSRVDSLYHLLHGRVPHVRIYKKADVPPELHYSRHYRIPPLVGIVDDGWTLTSHAKAEQSDHFLWGNHGYDPKNKDMWGILYARGPAFKADTVIAPIQNIHLYNLMAKIMAVPPAPNDGDFSRIRFILTPPYR